jgi:outer membrane biosynthesis protein TonB
MEPSENFDDLDQPTFFQRHPLAIGAVLALVAGVIAAIAIAAFSQQKLPSRSQQLQVVQILPPPPPPPTPPPQQATPPPEKMVEQQKMIEPESKPKENEPPKPHEAPPGPLGLNAKGEGPGDAFGLVGRPGGNGLLGGGGGGGGASRWGWYANEVQNGITTALRNNPRTRTAKFSNLSIRIWLNKGGRITRTQLSGSSGDPAVDNAIVNEALSGLQMQEPPPGDMPMPIVLRASARRP